MAVLLIFRPSAFSLMHLHSFNSPASPVCQASRLLNIFSYPRFYSAKSSRRVAVSSRVVKNRRQGEADVECKVKRNENGRLMVKEDNICEGNRIVQSELHKEAMDSYMAYAMSVLLGRALPDVRDGLKPVHRRIIFAMHELGLSSRKPYKKCARVVGEVLGKFHPHGDTAVYDALVRMAQGFSLRFPLIQGHGNFGSVDADPPAAMRYTECRLDPVTEAVLLSDIEQNTVDFVPNFDNSQEEPVILPARLPTLLLNGSSGIAVGMATNIPPHNLGEVVDALCFLIDNPDCSIEEMVFHMPGPDFPTGGLVKGNAGLLDVYHTGKGRIVVRGKADMEVLDLKTQQAAIIIKEIPYQVNKSTLVEKIAELVESKVLEGISDIRDESDRSGMRIVVELKKGSDSSLILNKLYQLTALQSSFYCNMVGILDGKPKLMGLKELLQAFLDFRCSVIEKRTRFKLLQAEERKHIVEGVIIGLDNIDDVIHTIREASKNSKALTDLMKGYGLSQKQAEALLDLTLRRLTSLERSKFVTEGQLLAEQISSLSDLLSSKNKMLQLVQQEANELKSKFSSPRRTVLEESSNDHLDEIELVPNDEMILALSEKGYIKRIKSNSFSLQKRGTIGRSSGKMRSNDAMSNLVVCRSHDHVLFFSDKGVAYSTRAYKIPECSRNTIGTPLVQVLSLSEGERITSVIPVNDFASDQYLVMLTLNGYIKKISLDCLSEMRANGKIAIELANGDELKWVRHCINDDMVVIASRNGMVLLACSVEIASRGRHTKGSTAMNLKEGDKMAFMDIIPGAVKHYFTQPHKNKSRQKNGCEPCLLFVTEGGLGKRVSLSMFHLLSMKKRGRIGYKLPSGDCIAAVYMVGIPSSESVECEEHIVLVSQGGIVVRMKVGDIPIQSRFARGVILMRLDYSGKVQSASLLSAKESDAYSSC